MKKRWKRGNGERVSLFPKSNNFKKMTTKGEKIKRKPRKSIMKRFKITKSGKILRRRSGQNHFRAKKSGSKKMALRKFIELSAPESKIIRRALGIKIKKPKAF